ncbi:hypothetical protein [Streptomyces phaeochromogenes]|nr:hypothetical protein [Streptomyces phaeochromogenes]
MGWSRAGVPVLGRAGDGFTTPVHGIRARGLDGGGPLSASMRR